MCGEICTDNRFEIIDAAKKRLIEATNIETNAKDMEALDSILYYEWMLGWLPGCEKHEYWVGHLSDGRGKTEYWTCPGCQTVGSPQWKRCPVCEAKMEVKA